MKSSEYWVKRAAALEYQIQSSTKKAIGEIAKQYGFAASAIEKEIVKIRRELMKLGKITEEELYALLTSAERKNSFHELRSLLNLTKNTEEASEITKRIDAQGYGTKITGLEALFNTIFAEILKAAAAEREICTILFEEIFQDTYFTTIFDLANGFDCGIDFEEIPKKILETILDEPWQGANYSERIWKRGEDFARQVQKTIKNGLLSGKSTWKMAEELTRFTEQGRYVAERLVRTEAAHFMAEGQRRAYIAAGIERYRFVAALSERTCEACAGLDDLTFSVDATATGANYPPIHPNCRCTTIPADVHLSSRVAEDPLSCEKYKVDGDVNFQQWVDGLSKEQRAVMKRHVDKFDKDGTMGKGNIATAAARYLNKRDQLYINAKNIKPLDGYEDIVCHGSPYGLVFKDGYGNESNVSAKEFVQMLETDPNYRGGNIRLIACETGAGEGIVPQYIADQLKVEVMAPTEIVFVFSDGKMIVSSNERDAVLGKETGEWIVFSPKKR